MTISSVLITVGVTLLFLVLGWIILGIFVLADELQDRYVLRHLDDDNEDTSK